MNRYNLKENLLCAIEGFSSVKGISLSYNKDYFFAVTRVLERGAKYNSKDEYMQRTVFSKENLEGKTINLG